MVLSKKFTSLFAALFAFAGFFFFIGSVSAITPTLSLSNTGNGDTVQLNVFGDANSIVNLYYNTPGGFTVGGIGTTNSSGSFSIVESTSQLNISPNSSVYVSINNQNSQSALWPNVSSTGTNSSLSLSQTSLVMTVGQTNTIGVTNTNNATLYVSNNSNPPVANINVSNTQISIQALSVGSSVVTVCPLGNTVNCPSIYITVLQSGSAQSLTFSQNNVSVAYGQTLPITVSGGTGVYTILNNSNSTVFSASLNGTTLSLYAEGSSGTGSVTVCSTDMSSCGIVTATIGNTTSTGIVFSQTNPVLGSGQSLPVSVSGGTGTYYVSANTNPSVISATISGNTLNLFGTTNGSATITVCSSSGGCNTITPTVNYTATGGAMTLSQTSITLLLGQTLSVTISGGEAPYNLASSNNLLFQSSLNNNIITITGLTAGSSVLSVCSAGGGCIGLSVTVNNAGVGTSGGQPSFSQNNISLSSGQSTSIALSGTGGYYVSNNSNSAVATLYVNGSSATITGNSLGSTNITVCQSGGQCNILSVNILSSTSGTTNGTINPVFNPSNVTVSAGQSTSVSISGGASTAYYLASNSNPSAAQVTLSGSALNITGESTGSSIIVVCSSANSCSPLFITVNTATVAQTITFNPLNPSVIVGQSAYVVMTGASAYYISSTQSSLFNASVSGSVLTLTGINPGSSSLTICSTTGSCVPLFVTVMSPLSATPVVTTSTGNSYQFVNHLEYGDTSNDVTELQERLTALGVYSGPITGYFGSLTEAAVKKYQAQNGLEQVGEVGPGTRALLNRY